jgi:LDH2 family malate/lactate/ureidoglycolate dehydrogenase
MMGDPASYMIRGRLMVETEQPAPGAIRIEGGVARSFVTRLFQALGVGSNESDLVAEVLVSADLRGIRSHGLARVPYFLIRLHRGVIDPHPEMSFTARTPTTGVLDAGNGIGIIAADRAMTEAMAMASEQGSGFVVVKDSSHFGYAGFWAERAMRAGMIGISMSNSGGRVAPTYGAGSVLGTNPLAVAIPGSASGTDFLLDMATSAVAVGKVETALREGRDLPPGWVVKSTKPLPGLDENGVLSFDSPLLPLGGEGTETGGHKGYGLALMVELLCGALGGTGFQARIEGAGGAAPPAMGHFMGAIQVEGFRSTEEVNEDMEETFALIRGSEKSPGQDRIYIHGEPEAIAVEENLKTGVPLDPTVKGLLDDWASRLSIEPLS